MIAATPARAAIWTSSGPAPAHVSGFGLDPTRPDTLFAGTSGGAVFRSTDGGTSWQRTPSTGDDPIQDIAVAGDVVLASSDSSFSSPAGGVYRSLDGGTSWSYAGAAAGLANALVGPVAIDPAASSTLLAGTNGGLFRSVDGGGSWAPVAVPSGPQLSDILFDPANPGVVYVATSNQGVSRSTDHGASFAAFNTGAVTDVSGLALAGTTLYASGFYGAYKTSTAAASWTDASNGLPSSPELSGLALDANGLIAPAGANVYTTATSFISWTSAVTPGFSAYRVVVDAATPTRLFLFGGGLARSTNAGASWERIDASIPGLGTSFVAGTASRALLVASDDGLLRSDDLGGTFAGSSSGLTSTYVPLVIVDPVDPANVYAVAGLSLFASTDGGSTWSAEPFGLSMYDPVLAVAASDPAVLYGAAFGGAIGIVKRSVDHGQSWQPVMAGASFNFPRGLAVDPTNADVAYLSTDTHLFATTNGGALWAPAETGLSAGSTGAIAIDPVEPATLYVVSGGSVWRSANQGGSWQPTSALPGGAQAAGLLVDPVSHATVYVPTDQGVLRSTDAGGSWQSLSDGLPNRHVRGLALDRGHAALYAATDGGLAVARFGAFLAGTTLPVAKRRATVGITCGGAEAAACTGTLTLASVPKGKKPRKARRLGSATFSVGPGETTTLRVRLKHVTVRAHRSVDADATIVRGAETSATRVTLTRP
ncbi:MAG: hypothetical protein U0807_06690 [Candidatus Binatia bacterium]